jgi:hypothetical protein
MRTPEQRERVAQAFLKVAHNKRLPAAKRMEARGQAKRWRGLAKWGKERDAAQKQDKSPPKPPQPANNP